MLWACKPSAAGTSEVLCKVATGTLLSAFSFRVVPEAKGMQCTSWRGRRCSPEDRFVIFGVSITNEGKGYPESLNPG